MQKATLKTTLVLAIFVMMVAGQVFAQDDLAIGEPNTGEAKGKALTYNLATEAGKGYVILVTSNDFDTYVALESADGDKLGENEDFYDYSSSFSYLSKLFFVASADSAVVVLNANYGDFEGEFEVTVTEVEVAGLEYGDTKEYDSENTVEYLTFEGKEGDVINLFTTSDDRSADSQISVQLNGVEVVYDYDSGTGYNAYLRRYSLLEDGLYVVAVSGYSDQPLGETVVTLEKTEALLLAPGDELDVTFGTEFDYENLTVDFKVGDTYTITLTSDNPSSYYVEVYFEGDTYSSKYLSFTSLISGSATFVADSSGVGRIKVSSSNFEEAEVKISLAGE
jgi:hypothetical protein